MATSETTGAALRWKDVKDSGTIATKVWRVTLPTAGGGEGKATFISVRHAAANLSLLFDGHQEHEWIHPEKEEEVRRRRASSLPKCHVMHGV